MLFLMYAKGISGWSRGCEITAPQKRAFFYPPGLLFSVKKVPIYSIHNPFISKYPHPLPSILMQIYVLNVIKIKNAEKNNSTMKTLTTSIEIQEYKTKTRQ